VGVPAHGLSFGLESEQLASLRKGDARKAALAARIRSRTCVPNAWIAEALQLGHVSRVNHCARNRPGARLPSEAQLVKRFSVSRPTVGRALRDLQEQGLIERRAGSGTYVRAEGGGAGATRSAFPQLGLIVPSLRHAEIFESICGELASLARIHDYALWWGGTPSRRPTNGSMSAAEAQTLCAQFIERGVSGVFFVPFEHRRL